MIPSNLFIKPVGTEEIEGVWPIIKKYSDLDIEAFKERMIEKSKLSDHYIPVAILDNRVVGYGWVHDYGQHIRTGHRTARLNDLFVLETERKRGIGRDLFRSMKEWCENRNVRWIQWQASENATAFYEKLGFKGDRCPDPDHPFFEIEYENR